MLSLMTLTVVDAVVFTMGSKIGTSRGGGRTGDNRIVIVGGRVFVGSIFSCRGSGR